MVFGEEIGKPLSDDRELTAVCCLFDASAGACQSHSGDARATPLEGVGDAVDPPSVACLKSVGELFDILVGTREGGVESPLLYVLFAADIIAHLEQGSMW